MPNVANVAAGLPGANVAAAANSLRRGGYNTFSAAFIYSCRNVGGGFLPFNIPIPPLPVANRIWVGLHFQRRESKNIKEIHWNSQFGGAGYATVKDLIDFTIAGFGLAAPNSATLIYFDDNSLN